MTKTDYTEGAPFWKWFFSQNANIFITLFWGIALSVVYYNYNSLFIGEGATFTTTFCSFICFFNLGMSYRDYRNLKKGISK